MINNYEALPRSTEFCYRARIIVIGMGMYGIDIVSQMQFDRPEVEFWAIDLNPEIIERSPISKSILLEDRSTWNEEISTALGNSDLIEIVAEVGNEDCIEATLAVSRVAKELGILTVSFVVKPFSFEGIERVERAQLDIDRLMNIGNICVVIPGDRLLPQSDGEVDRETVLELANSLIRTAIQSIADTMSPQTLSNLDFADFRCLFNNGGLAYFGMGESEGEAEFMAKDAALKSILASTIECPIEKALSLSITIYGGSDMTMKQLDLTLGTIYELVNENVNLMYYVCINESMNGKMRISSIATNLID